MSQGYTAAWPLIFQNRLLAKGKELPRRRRDSEENQEKLRASVSQWFKVWFLSRFFTNLCKRSNKKILVRGLSPRTRMKWVKTT
jgi:hypothetical protein